MRAGLGVEAMKCLPTRAIPGGGGTYWGKQGWDETMLDRGASPGARTTSFQFIAGTAHPITPERFSCVGRLDQMTSHEPSG